jgi:hypothetical protein
MSLARRIQRKTQRLLKKGALNSGPVILRWRERSGSAPTFDPQLQVSKAGSTYTEKTETLKAFIHYVNIHTTGYTRHAEIKIGDVILDFLGDANLDGREGLEFEIGGNLYVQKNGGKDLAESWDVRCNGIAITRTVLVTLKS